MTQELLDFAVDAAHRAGALTLGWFRTDPTIDLKDDRTPVTVADRAAEQFLRERIRAAYPDHGIVGEEFGVHEGRAPGRWILDPIDGTFSFICGVPLYAVLIGFEWEGRMEVGVIHLPALGETVYAARGLGCRWNGRPARVSRVTDLSAATLVVTDRKTVERANRRTAYERLFAACRAERGWSDAYSYALLATGRVDVVVDAQMSLWDTAALVPVISEAGGRLTDWSGRDDHAAPEAVATNGLLHERVISILGQREA